MLSFVRKAKKGTEVNMVASENKTSQGNFEVQVAVLSVEPPLTTQSPQLTQEKMLRASGSAISMEGTLKQQQQQQLLNYKCQTVSRSNTVLPFVRASSVAKAGNSSPLHLRLPRMMARRPFSVKVYAMRRRRVHDRTGTYVLLEPGEDERFVSQEELKAALKGYLENWPKKELPPDLAGFETIDDAVSFLVSSVCELEIVGNVGSVQWYEVRLE